MHTIAMPAAALLSHALDATAPAPHVWFLGGLSMYFFYGLSAYVLPLMTFPAAALLAREFLVGMPVILYILP